MLDVDSLRAALKDVSTLFLLNAGAPDEFTQALIVLNLARDAGINRIVYFSVINSDIYVDVPHFAAKHAVERATSARSPRSNSLSASNRPRRCRSSDSIWSGRIF